MYTCYTINILQIPYHIKNASFIAIVYHVPNVDSQVHKSSRTLTPYELLLALIPRKTRKNKYAPLIAHIDIIYVRATINK